MGEARYRAFVSYCSADRRSAAWLHRALEAYRPPRGTPAARERLAPVFLDRAELTAGHSLSEALQDALARSEWLIVVCSPAAAASRWVDEEIRYFRELGHAGRILCLLVDGTPADAFPPSLGHGDEEPLAADLQRDGRRGALLKLAAPMLGVAFDELARREQSRRTARLATVAATTTVGMVAMLALTVYAFAQRAEATRQEALAEREAAAANEVTDFLVDLFRLADPVTENPDTITARTLIERGARKLDEELGERPELKSRLLGTIGTVQMNLGLRQEAASTLADAIALAAPGEDALELRVEQAAVLTELGRLDEAAAILAPFAGIEETLDPLLRLAMLRARGNMRMLEPDAEAAARDMEAAVALAREHPGVERMELARSLSDLSQIYMNLQRPEDAITVATQALEIQRASLGDGHLQVAVARHNLAEQQTFAGRFTGVVETERAALATFERLLDADHPFVAQAHRTLANGYRGTGDLDCASDHMGRAIENGRRAFGADHGFVALALSDLAFIHSETGARAAADASLAEARGIFTRTRGPDHDFVAWVEILEARLAARFDDRARQAERCATARATLDRGPAPDQEYQALWEEHCGAVTTAGS
jgi:tetratricopeptide (TPR) repeat protein